MVTEGRTYGRTDRLTDRNMQGRIEKPTVSEIHSKVVWKSKPRIQPFRPGVVGLVLTKAMSCLNNNALD